MTGGSRCGIVLVLTAGFLSLLAFLALAIAQTARVVQGTSGAALSFRQADLAVESGFHYAAARLEQAPHSTPRDDWTQANACDDWTCRDFSPAMAGDPLPQGLNPSYGHGEWWKDLAGGKEGVYETSLDDTQGSIDRDGDGRFSAWSGWVRTAGAAACFSLRILSEPSLACINSGELCASEGDQDLDGVPNGKDGDFSTDRNMDKGGQLIGNGIPDWRDPDYVGNRHLVNLLDNLGAILAVSSLDRNALYWPDDDPDKPVLGRIETSSLGRQIVAGRLCGGYASVEQLGSVLNERDYALAAPFLSVHGEIVPIPFQVDRNAKDNIGEVTLSAPEVRYEFHARIDFNNAPEELIRASLRYLSVSGTGSEDGSSEGGTAFFRFHAREESDAVARILAESRPIWTWQQLLRTLVDKVPASTWQRDPFYQGAEELLVLEGEGLPLLKQEMILAQFDANWLLPDPFTWRRNGWETDRETDAYRGTDRTRIVQLSKEHFAGPLSTSPFDNAGEPVGNAITTLPGRLTTEYVLTSHKGAYRIACGGWTASPGKMVTASIEREIALILGGEPFRATSQSDFEQASASLATPWRYPGGVVSAVGPAWRRGVQTTPRFPFRSPDRGNYPPTSTTSYPRAYGGLQLAARQLEMSELTAPGCTFALPFNEDGEPDTGNRWDPADWFDNMADPVERPPAREQYFIARSLYDQGIWPSPCGQRNAYGLQATWDAAAPFGGIGANGVSRGTISFWCAQTGANENPDWFATSLTPRVVLELRYLSGTIYVSYLNISNDYLTNRLKVDNLGGSALRRGYLTEAPEETLMHAPWHHVAVTFHPGATGQTAIRIYIDGKPAESVTNEGGEPVPLPLPVSTDPDRLPSASSLQLQLYGPLDDVLFFSDTLPAEEILALARKPRFHADPSGADPARYASPRFRFDPARLPEGAVLSGATWEAFIPKTTGGSFTFEVTGYDEDGTPVGSSGPIPYDGTQIPRTSFRLVGCRFFDFTVRIDTDPAAWPLLQGQPALRDTPLLEEFRIFYRSDRPGWTPY